MLKLTSPEVWGKKVSAWSGWLQRKEIRGKATIVKKSRKEERKKERERERKKEKKRKKEKTV